MDIMELVVLRQFVQTGFLYLVIILYVAESCHAVTPGGTDNYAERKRHREDYDGGVHRGTSLFLF